MRNSLILLLLSLCFGVFSAQAKTVTDITGRRRGAGQPAAHRGGESRMLYTLALLEPGNPAQRIVGWPADLARFDAQSWQLYTQKFPQIAAIPIISGNNFRQSILKACCS